MSELRATAFRRNELLESLLTNIGDDLQPAEEKLITRYEGEPLRHPCIFVMGPLRSGTTLFMQWLANTGLVAYPTNLLSRFYRSPIIGTKIQLLLTDSRYNFRDELGEFMAQLNYSSENGKTKGVLAPNEFWYFWRRFLADPTRDVWSDNELRQTMDVRTMKSELAGMIDVFDKPFAAKGMLFNYNIPFLDSVLEKAVFIQIIRDPVANVASVLEARKRQLGNEAAWYSFKIPEYQELMELDPLHQAAGQVQYINRAVTAGMKHLEEHRRIVVQYEDFCERPKIVFEELCSKLGVEGLYNGPSSFQATREGANKDSVHIKAALETFIP